MEAEEWKGSDKNPHGNGQRKALGGVIFMDETMQEVADPSPFGKASDFAGPFLHPSILSSLVLITVSL
jgi:hypothetical protein